MQIESNYLSKFCESLENCLLGNHDYEELLFDCFSQRICLTLIALAGLSFFASSEDALALSCLAGLPFGGITATRELPLADL